MVNRELTVGEVFGIILMGILFVSASLIGFMTLETGIALALVVAMLASTIFWGFCAYKALKNERKNNEDNTDYSKGLDYM